jgi:hypothetical protein
VCREGAWAELTVKVTSVRPFRGAARVKKVIIYDLYINSIPAGSVIYD